MYVAVVSVCLCVCVPGCTCVCGEGHLHDTNFQLIYQLKTQMAYSYAHCSRVGTNAKFGFYIVVLHIRQILERKDWLIYVMALWFPNLLLRD